ncbi:MAG: baseplate assembly protein [Calditrichaeota bacterium]|nr:MAG: baseplate assembly protein [Calditrichota bacterium]
MKQFFGKYRGKVENNLDPLQIGRIQVSVPAVLGEGRLSWAMPCVPYAGSGVGFFMIPPVGANVWVEFEGGNPDYPIWTGCFWGTGEVPASPAVAEIKIIKTDAITLSLSELPGAGGFTLEVNPPIATPGIKITANATGVEISNGIAKVKLTQAMVSVNDGALEVM